MELLKNWGSIVHFWGNHGPYLKDNSEVLVMMGIIFVLGIIVGWFAHHYLYKAKINNREATIASRDGTIAGLNSEIKLLERNNQGLKDDLQKEKSSFERENARLKDKINELEKEKISLQERIGSLGQEKKEIAESFLRQIAPLRKTKERVQDFPLLHEIKSLNL